MITQTIKEAMMNNNPIIPGYVYVVRDSKVIFYVGISKDPYFRLCQHLGIADAWNTYTFSREKLIYGMERKQSNIIAIASFSAHQLGKCILDNAPESLEWSFDIYEKEDAIAVIKRIGYAQIFPKMLELMEINWYEQRTIVENALIKELEPYLNIIDNDQERDLPEKYKKNINLDDNAVDHIHL